MNPNENNNLNNSFVPNNNPMGSSPNNNPLNNTMGSIPNNNSLNSQIGNTPDNNNSFSNQMMGNTPNNNNFNNQAMGNTPDNNNSFNNQMMVNTPNNNNFNNQMGGMPNNQPVMPNSNPTNQSPNPAPNKGKNNKLLIIIGVIVVVIICLFLGFRLLGGSSGVGGSSSGSQGTVNMNDNLKVKNDLNDFSLKIENIEENYTKGDSSYVFTRIKIKIINNSSNNINLWSALSLVDETDKEVSYINIVDLPFTDIDDDLELNILGNETKEGYLYFDQPETAFSKLKVRVNKSVNLTDDGVLHSENEDYYIKLK